MSSFEISSQVNETERGEFCISLILNFVVKNKLDFTWD